MANSSISFGTFNPSTFFIPNAEENNFDHIYYGGKGLKRDGTPAGVGDDVYEFVDVKGGNNMVWGYGTDVAAVFNRLPWRIDNKRVRFDNNPYTSFKGSTITGGIAYEVWREVVEYVGQSSERFDATFPYSANGGDNDLRLLSPVLSVAGGAFTKYQRTLYRIKKNADRTAQLWVNGEYRGFVTGDEDYPLTIASIGTDTNCAEFDFGAMYVKKGSTFTDEVADAIAASIMAKFNDQSIPCQLMLNNITATKVGSTYGNTFNQIQNDGLVYKDVSQWLYRWSTVVFVIGGNYTIQPLLSTSATPTQSELDASKAAFNSANPSTPIVDGAPLKLRVCPVRTDNSVWRFMSGSFQAF